MGLCKQGHGVLVNGYGVCPECAKPYQKRYRKESGYKSRKHVLERRRREAQRKQAIDFLGGQCKDCGIGDPRVLVFDHITEDKESNVAGLLGKAWERIVLELNKCELVCANCHLIRTNERIPKAQDTFIFSKAVPRDRIDWGQPLLINGDNRTLRDWTELSGLALGTVSRRIHLGWAKEKAVTEPAREWNRWKRKQQ